MKTKILLVFCLMQLVSISVFGQHSYSHDEKTVTIDGVTINKPSHSMSSNNTRSNSSNITGDMVSNIILNLLFNNNSNASQEAAVKQYREEQARKELLKEQQQQTLKNQNLAANLKGGGQKQKLEFKRIEPNIENQHAQPYIAKSSYDSMKEMVTKAGLNFSNYFSEAEWNGNPREMTYEELLRWHHNYNRLINDLYGSDQFALLRELDNTVIDKTAEVITSIPSDITPFAVPLVNFSAAGAKGMVDYLYGGQNISAAKIGANALNNSYNYYRSSAISTLKSSTSEHVVAPALSKGVSKVTGKTGETINEYYGDAVTIARDKISEKITNKIFKDVQ